MGIAVGDYNRDGKVDLYITNFPTITTRFIGMKRRGVRRRQFSRWNRDTDDPVLGWERASRLR